MSARRNSNGPRLLPRRAFLKSAAAGAAACALPRLARGSQDRGLPSEAANRRFTVLYKGSRIGAHAVSYSAATGDTRIITEIDMLVKLAFFTVFAFSHHSEETWRDGQLVSLKSDTLDHGERLHVEGTAIAQGFRVVSGGGPFIASAATLTSNSLWTPAVLRQATVVDAQHGGVIGVSARKFADEQIEAAGRPIRASRYTFITPYVAGSLWYDMDDMWVCGEFERDGSKIQYQLDA